MTLSEVLRSLQSIKLSSPETKMPLITDEPKIPGYLCFPSEETTSIYDTQDVFGQGFDPNDTKARVKSVGEFLERLCLYNPEIDRFLRSRYKPNDNFVDPGLFCCYSDEQLSREDFIEDSRREEYLWMQVIDFASDEKRFIPAQLVFLSHVFDDEFPIQGERISTGAALGPKGTAHALTNGLMESVERDACIHSYLTRRDIKRIVDLPQQTNDLVAYLRRYQLEPYIFDVTSDLDIPTALVITLDHTGIGGAINVGSRSSTTYEDAVKYALLESIQCRRTSRVLRKLEPKETLLSEDEVISMDNRFFYWHPTERIRDLDFWLSSQSEISYRDLRRKNITFEKAVENLQSRKYHVFVADMTLPPISNGGFEALKVVIPELHPMYLDERAKALYSVHYGAVGDDKKLKPHPLT